MKIKYTDRKFTESSLRMIGQANQIITKYTADGYDLTLRQLYYQFVARDLLANTDKNYKRLASIINDARLAGLVDWDTIVDRTRGLEKQATWDSPGGIIDACASSFRIDKWANQPCRVECWIEKEALANVFERICKELRIPYLACRGYTSQSEMWRAGQRLTEHLRNNQRVIIFHFGDHDPSGVDMSRDIDDRLRMFMGGAEFHRLALNMDQVEEYDPPPNPAKTSDSRSQGYIDTFSGQSWELDALEPSVLSGLLRDRVEAILDQDAWKEATATEEEHKRLLAEVADKWDTIVEDL